ncbi:MAG: 50S ribosomal protein L11 methyltransferase [Alphaproteobacteria bacterium]|nr:50S ribosomal protein L11 methyltransferase [Alphaproteobacteria bacterium]
MSNKSGSCKVIKFAPCDDIAPELMEFAEDYFEVTSQDYNDDGSVSLVGYMRYNDDENELIRQAAQSGIVLPPYSVEIVHSDNWLADNVIEFAPVEVGDFLIYGIHEKNINLNDKIGIKVYAATAFGSEHQTTKSCLQGILDINQLSGEVRHILDVGTGSGILAIAAAKLWPNSKIVAVDIDEEAVQVAAQNAADNDVTSNITAAYSDGYTSDIVRNSAPYDVILANILARPLIAMAHDMSLSLKVGGYAVISGFIDEQVDWVLNAHEQCSLKLVKLYKIDNWCAALLKRI